MHDRDLRRDIRKIERLFDPRYFAVAPVAMIRASQV